MQKFFKKISINIQKILLYLFWIKFKQDVISDISAEVVIEKVDFPEITKQKKIRKSIKRYMAICKNTNKFR